MKKEVICSIRVAKAGRFALISAVVIAVAPLTIGAVALGNNPGALLILSSSVQPAKVVPGDVMQVSALIGDEDEL